MLNTLLLDIVDRQIQVIRTVTNPDKLGHVGPVADPWTVLRAANSRPGSEGGRTTRTAESPPRRDDPA